MAVSGCPSLIGDGVYNQVLNVMGDFWANSQEAQLGKPAVRTEAISG